MKDFDLDTLARLAAAATPGPWDGTPGGPTAGLSVTVWACGGDVPVCDTLPHVLRDGEQAVADAAYVAAMNPVVGAALVAEVAALRAERDAWKAAVMAEWDWATDPEDVAGEVKNYRDQIHGLAAEVGELRAALKPFAYYALGEAHYAGRHPHLRYPDGEMLMVCRAAHSTFGYGVPEPYTGTVTIGDCRRAAALLAPRAAPSS